MWNPPDPSSYNAVVWEIVKQIPVGKVSTYGQIASMLPPPEGIIPPQYEKLGSRWVGSAMRATPSGEGIPWQRVINSQGKISLPEGSEAALRQQTLLEDEGVIFVKGRVDFEVVGWEGPDAAWLHARDLYPPFSLKKRPNQPQQGRLI